MEGEIQWLDAEYRRTEWDGRETVLSLRVPVRVVGGRVEVVPCETPRTADAPHVTITPAADPFVLAMACPLCHHAMRPRRVRPLNRVLIRGDFSCQRCETIWQASRSWPLTKSAWLLDETSVHFGYRPPVDLH